MTVPTIVFVDGARVEVRSDSTALDAVRTRSAERASEVEQGSRVITDSRGLTVPSDTPVHGGAIFRVILRRADAADVGQGVDAAMPDEYSGSSGGDRAEQGGEP